MRIEWIAATRTKFHHVRISSGWRRGGNIFTRSRPFFSLHNSDRVSYIYYRQGFFPSGGLCGTVSTELFGHSSKTDCSPRPDQASPPGRAVRFPGPTFRGATVADVQRGLTVPELAQRYRCSQDKVRNWIRAGRLPAVNTSSVRCARPRFVVLPEHLAAFEKGIAADTPSAPKSPRRPKRPAGFIDFFPD